MIETWIIIGVFMMGLLSGKHVYKNSIEEVSDRDIIIELRERLRRGRVLLSSIKELL